MCHFLLNLYKEPFNDSRLVFQDAVPSTPGSDAETPAETADREAVKKEVDKKERNKFKQLAETHRPAITRFVSERESYSKGNWRQWNKDFAERTGLSADEAKATIRRMQRAVFAELGLEHEGVVDGKLGPYTINALAAALELRSPEKLPAGKPKLAGAVQEGRPRSELLDLVGIQANMEGIKGHLMKALGAEIDDGEALHMIELAVDAFPNFDPITANKDEWRTVLLGLGLTASEGAPKITAEEIIDSNEHSLSNMSIGQILIVRAGEYQVEVMRTGDSEFEVEGVQGKLTTEGQVWQKVAEVINAKKQAKESAEKKESAEENQEINLGAYEAGFAAAFPGATSMPNADTFMKAARDYPAPFNLTDPIAWIRAMESAGMSSDEIAALGIDLEDYISGFPLDNA
jgi:hypothetical protein